jgi:hypothetical protein
MHMFRNVRTQLGHVLSILQYQLTQYPTIIVWCKQFSSKLHPQYMVEEPEPKLFIVLSVWSLDQWFWALQFSFKKDLDRVLAFSLTMYLTLLLFVVTMKYVFLVGALPCIVVPEIGSEIISSLREFT